jgi:predicted TIM-barrel fold metal-dependent hydrolase
MNATQPVREFKTNDNVDYIRNAVDHPIIDGDGHVREVMPLVFEILRDIAGEEVTRRAQEVGRKHLSRVTCQDLPSDQRGTGLGVLEATLDGVTLALPELLATRRAEIGFDFLLLYPSMGLRILAVPDADVRQGMARALNIYYSEVYGSYRDRMEPVAVIPTFTPTEAIEELEFAVETLGLKAVVMSGVIPRSDASGGTWLDTLGHGSAYDYDPLWQRCLELKVAPAFHGVGSGWGTRASKTNFTYNHVGHFAAAQESACRSLVMGGIARRFPGLRFAFLEGGVTWGCQLLADLIGHFEKRNQSALAEAAQNYDLESSDALFSAFARGRVVHLEREVKDELVDSFYKAASYQAFDEFAESLISRSDDLVAAFADQFFFGCEADDPYTGLAFDKKYLPNGARLNPLLGSDIGHWDVRDIRMVLPEAWELVEKGTLTPEDFRDFTFGNVVRMLTDVNPDFFKGTAVETSVDNFIRDSKVGKLS